MSSKLLGIENTETDGHDLDSQVADLAACKDTVGKTQPCPRLQFEVQEQFTNPGVQTSAGEKTAQLLSASEETTMTKNASSHDNSDASSEGATSALTFFSLKKRLLTRRHSDDFTARSEKGETSAAPKRRNPARKQTERRNSLDFHFGPTPCSDFAGRDDFEGERSEGRGGWGTALSSSLKGITSSLVGSKLIHGDESNVALQELFWQKDKSLPLSPQQKNRSSSIQRRIVDALAGSFTSLSEEQVRKMGDAFVGSDKSDGESGKVDQFEIKQTPAMGKSKKTPSHMHKSMPVPVPVARSGRRRGHQQNTNAPRRSDDVFNSISNANVSPSIKADPSKEPCIDHDSPKASTSSKIRPLHREALKRNHSDHDNEVRNTGEDLDPKNGNSHDDDSRGVNPDHTSNTNHPVYRTLHRAGTQRRHSNQRRRSDSNHDDFEIVLSKSLSRPKTRRRSSLSNLSLQDNTVDNRDHPVYKTLHRAASRRSVSFDQQQIQGNKGPDKVSEPMMDKQVLFPQSAPISNSTRRRSSNTSDYHDDRLRRNFDHPASHTLRRTGKYRRSSFDQVEGIRMSNEEGRINKANATFEEATTTANAPYDVVFPRSVKLSNIRRCSSMSEYEVQHKMNHPVYKTLLRVHKLRRSSINEDETHNPESERIMKNWFGDISESSSMSTIQRQGSSKYKNLVNIHGKVLPQHIPFLSHSYQPSQSRRLYHRDEDLHAAEDYHLFRGNRVRDDNVTNDPIQNLIDSIEFEVTKSTSMSETYKPTSMADIQSEDNTIHPKRVAQGSNLETTSHKEETLVRLESTKAERATSEQHKSPQRTLTKGERSLSLTQRLVGDLAVEVESACKPTSHSPE